jgi:hypothetical protein
MSVLPNLERELHAAASRPRRRLRPTTPGGLALLIGTTAAAATAGAAGLGIIGPDPKSDEAFDTQIGAVAGRPVTSGLLPVSAPDPDGGAPWALRVTKTDRGAACIQLGRKEDGRLVHYGADGAFDNDGRAHEVPVGRDICVPTDSEARPKLRARSTQVTASGLLQCQPAMSRKAYDDERLSQSSTPEARRLRRQGRKDGYNVPVPKPATDAEWRTITQGFCRPGKRRLVRWGFAGPDARTASLTDAQGQTTTVEVANGTGAYVFAQRLADDAQAFVRALKDPAPISVTFADGRTRRLTGPGRIPTIPGYTKRRTQRRGPLNLRIEHPRTPTDPIRLTFTAPVDALEFPTAFQAYTEYARTDDAEAKRCRETVASQGDEIGKLSPRVRKSERVVLTLAPPRHTGRPDLGWRTPGTRLRLEQIGGSRTGSITLHTSRVRVRQP